MKKVVNDIRDLAAVLGLSITTVSRVLNGKAKTFRISDNTKERVLKAATDYNYSPNKIARGLKLSKTETLGLIIPDISNPFFSDIASSIEREAYSKGYSLILCDSNEDQKMEDKLIELLKSHKVDGIIIAPVSADSEKIKQTYNSGMPLIVIDRSFPDAGLPSITSDNYQGGFEAVNYLIAMGHKKISCIQGIPKSHPSQERVRGFKDALKNGNIHFDNNMIVGDDFSIDNGYRQTRILFSLENPPTAIFALSNQIGLGVIQAIHEVGLKIPEDISLISFDEQHYSAFLGTPMTTVGQKKSEMGQLAVAVLLDYIKNKEFNKKVVNILLKTTLIVRNSVKRI